MATLTEKKAAYEAGKAQLAANKATYEAGKAKLAASKPQLDAAKTQLDAAAKTIAAGEQQLAAGKAKLDAAAKQLADGKSQLAQYEQGKAKLEAAATQLTEGKAKLDAASKQLADGKAQLQQFEDGQAQVDAGVAKLEENADVKAKIDSGMDAIAAGRAVVDEQTAKTTKELMARVYQYGMLLLVALFGIIASILGLGAAKAPSIGKIKGGVILGILALVVAIAANVYGAMNGYSAFQVQMTAMIAECLFALLFVVSIFKYKNALVALMTAE